ncbi:hypothetical protein RRF57_001073 [Xylaria bambusicola]|uniref:Uncharacterized protein n=1 Tax=Xylaria bambusicola TaxID=326684 RepID=A0AAN7Z1A8_9PEZI
MKKEAAEASVKAFFASPQFAVAGASSNPANPSFWFQRPKTPENPHQPSPKLSPPPGKRRTRDGEVRLGAVGSQKQILPPVTRAPFPGPLEILRGPKNGGHPCSLATAWHV